jgi:hypothetical protein
MVRAKPKKWPPRSNSRGKRTLVVPHQYGVITILQKGPQLERDRWWALPARHRSKKKPPGRTPAIFEGKGGGE